MKAGKLWVLEGIDGTGKSTHATRLANEFGLAHFREPGSTPVSEQVRSILLKNTMEPATRALLYIAARTEFVNTILLPVLNSGRDVILERYFYSTLVYQKGVLPGNAMRDLHSTMPEPDMVFLLDCPAEIAQQRDIDPNDAITSGKSASYFQSLRNRYTDALRRTRHVVVDANVPMDEVYENIVRVLARENPNRFSRRAP